jgi:hypothetical protein
MKNNFMNLEIGDKFHTGKSQGMGANSNVTRWIEFEKISKSKAKIINQVGFGNTRMVGTIQPFTAYSSVWKIGE